jgi:hypothetical protein
MYSRGWSTRRGAHEELEEETGNIWFAFLFFVVLVFELRA